MPSASARATSVPAPEAPTGAPTEATVAPAAAVVAAPSFDLQTKAGRCDQPAWEQVEANLLPPIDGYGNLLRLAAATPPGPLLHLRLQQIEANRGAFNAAAFPACFAEAHTLMDLQMTLAEVAITRALSGDTSPALAQEDLQGRLEILVAFKQALQRLRPAP